MMSNYPAHWFQTLKQTGIAVNIFEHSTRGSKRTAQVKMSNHAQSFLWLIIMCPAQKHSTATYPSKNQVGISVWTFPREMNESSLKPKLCGIPSTKRWSSARIKISRPLNQKRSPRTICYISFLWDPLRTMSDVSVPDPKSKFVSLNVKHLR